jgi:putative phosphoribosyl transferase
LRPRIGAIVSRGGRADLAWDALEQVHAPTLLIVGGRDAVVIALNQQAYERLNAEKQLVIIPGATHLFEEREALEEVARLAKHWSMDDILDPAPMWGGFGAAGSSRYPTVGRNGRKTAQRHNRRGAG